MSSIYMSLASLRKPVSQNGLDRSALTGCTSGRGAARPIYIVTVVAPVRILVVDDEALIARLLTTVLQGDGHGIIVFDYQYFRHDFLYWAVSASISQSGDDVAVTGIRMEIVVPWPGSLSTATAPPWARTM